MTADGDQRFRIDGQADHRARRVVQKFRRRDARYQRHVRRLDAAIGEIKAGRRFRRAGHPHQHDIGLDHAAHRLPVIMGDHIMHRVDAAEIIGIEHILPARLMLHRSADLRLQHVEHGIEHMQQGNPHARAGGIELTAQRIIHQAAQHWTRLSLHAFQNTVQLQPRPDQRPAMIGHLGLVKLGHSRARQGVQSIPSGVGYQVYI
jgi:hypothetical protein